MALASSSIASSAWARLARRWYLALAANPKSAPASSRGAAPPNRRTASAALATTRRLASIATRSFGRYRRTELSASICESGRESFRTPKCFAPPRDPSAFVCSSEARSPEFVFVTFESTGAIFTRPRASSSTAHTTSTTYSSVPGFLSRPHTTAHSVATSAATRAATPPSSPARLASFIAAAGLATHTRARRPSCRNGAATRGSSNTIARISARVTASASLTLTYSATSRSPGTTVFASSSSKSAASASSRGRSRSF